MSSSLSPFLSPYWISRISFPLLVLALILSFAFQRTAALELEFRDRVPVPGSENQWEVRTRAEAWDPKRTAVVVCDMWDRHWCPDATERVAEMVPRMNAMLHAARDLGMLIIHCPSDTMGFYEGHPARKRAQAAPKIETDPPLTGWCSLDESREGRLPIDDSDEGCDGCPDCPPHRAWSRQHPGLDILDDDAITDSAEAYYLMRQQGITNVLVMGVHINMCVLGRPFSIRQMVYQGQNVALVRDMTDSMYNHRQRPYVSHFRGTELVVEHIEKHWCPSITSTDLLGGEPFRFRGDVRKRIALVTGEDEYDTASTLERFAAKELAWRGYEIVHVAASPTPGDTRFENVDQLEEADLIVLSVRRRAMPTQMLTLLKRHLDQGKPLVGLRTASHAFDPRPKVSGFADWPGFDVDILGMRYEGHYSNKPPKDPPTIVQRAREAIGHPVLTGVPAQFESTSHLYKNREPADEVTVLSVGHVGSESMNEPVNWIVEQGGRRVFYTALGNPSDFSGTAFRRLLLNGILWTLREFIPPEQPDEKEAASRAAQPPARSVESSVRGQSGADVLSSGDSQLSPEPQAALSAVPPGTFPQLESVDIPQRANSGPLTSDVAAKHFRIADDIDWEVVLAEPVIQQPVFLNFDERGRLWVVEYRQYPHPAGLKLVSRDSVWRAVYDKVPPPPPNHFPGQDRISIHEDTNGDGEFDRHTVFVEGLNIVTAVERGRGGVWVLNPPYLLFYPDANNDDVPDGPPEVRLSGFGLEDTHSVVNSLCWGPDGWLYGAQGSTVTAQVYMYGLDGQILNEKPVYSQGQNIWRYHPERRLYEVFSEGGGNAFGCEIDSRGWIFSGHNGGGTRGFHYVQGAYLQKGFEKHGPLSNPYAYGYFPPMAHDNVPRFTHTFVIYEGDALPARYHHRLLGVEPLQGRLVLSELIPTGSTFRTVDLGRPVISEDRWFRPVDIKIGPDGYIYVCDWYDEQVNHYRNHEGDYDPERGRIYRMKPKGAVPEKLSDLAEMEPREWVSLLEHPNRAIRRTAQRLLADRREVSLGRELGAQLGSLNGQAALETLWATHLSGGWNTATSGVALGHREAAVREWAVRLLGDFGDIPETLVSRLVELGEKEQDIHVRIQLAASARRLPSGMALRVLRPLLQRAEDLEDPRMPLMLWWAVEAHCENGRRDILSLFEEPGLWEAPLVQSTILERLARRWAQSGTRPDLLACARLFELAPDRRTAGRLTTGFEAGMRGRSLAGLPDELVGAMARFGVGSVLLGVRRGDVAAIEQALVAVADETESRARRLEYLSVFQEVPVPQAIGVLIQTFRAARGDDELRREILAALEGYRDLEVAHAVLNLYPRLGKASLASAQSLLVSRPEWAREFLNRLEAGAPAGFGPAVDPGTVPLGILRKLQTFKDEAMQKQIGRIWPDVAARLAASGDFEKEVERWRASLDAGHGDPYHGRTLYRDLCSSCHVLFDEGARVGPELTTMNRSDADTLLLGIVNPSAEIREGYETLEVETKDGRLLTGFLVEQDDRTLVFRGLDNRDVVLDKAEIETLQMSGSSLMPEGLLTALDAQDVRDLFAYLRSTQPLVGSPPPRP